jgi:hypothetical protein
MLVPHVRFAPKNLFLLPKYNIMSPWWPTWHIGVRLAHMSAQLSMNFLDETQNVAKMWFEPATAWSLVVFTTRLLLRLCCCGSYYFFVLCSGVLIRSSQHENGSRTCHLLGPVSMVVRPTCQVQSTWQLSSNSSLNSNWSSNSKSNLNLGQGQYFFPIGFIPNIARIRTQIQV